MEKPILAITGFVLFINWPLEAVVAVLFALGILIPVYAVKVLGIPALKKGRIVPKDDPPDAVTPPPDRRHCVAEGSDPGPIGTVQDGRGREVPVVSLPVVKEEGDRLMTKRVYELAKEYGVESKDLVRSLNADGFAVKNYMSLINMDQVKRVKGVLGEATVQRRLKDWRGLLAVRERIAHARQFSLKYSMYTRRGNSNRFLDFFVEAMDGQERVEWGKVKRAIKQEIQCRPLGNGAEDRDDPPRSLMLGEIVRVSEDNRVVGIRLAEGIRERLDGIDGLLPPQGILSYTPEGDLREIRNQSGGLDRLTRGLVQNRLLGEFLFDASVAAPPDPKQGVSLSRKGLLLPYLNDLQLEAVEKALNCPDLCLIKGPPGTGKTTVIAEICYQMAKRGQRILISSQSNLAIDNALDKLVHDPSIRTLRLGREERIEEEGRPFMGSRVVDTWLKETAGHCTDQWDMLEKEIRDIEPVLSLRESMEEYAECVKRNESLESEAEHETKQWKGRAGALEGRKNELKLRLGETEALKETMERLLDRLGRGENPAGTDPGAVPGLERLYADPRYADYTKTLDLLLQALSFLSDTNAIETEWGASGTSALSVAVETGILVHDRLRSVQHDYAESLASLASLRELLPAYDSAASDFARLQTLAQHVEARIKGATQEMQAVGNDLRSLRLDRSAFNTFIPGFREGFRPIIIEWHKALGRLIAGRSRGAGGDDMGEPPSPQVPETLITREHFSRIWKEVIPAVMEEFRGWLGSERDAADGKRVLEDLGNIRGLAGTYMNQCKERQEALGWFCELREPVGKESPVTEILRRNRGGRGWVTVRQHSLLLEAKAREFLEGGAFAKITDRILGGLSSELASKRMAYRAAEGFWYFKAILETSDQALKEMDSLLKANWDERKRAEKAFVELTARTIVTKAHELAARTDAEIRSVEMRLRELSVEKESALRKLEELKGHQTDRSTALVDLAARIRSVLSREVNTVAPAPLSELQTLARAISETESPGDLIRRWNNRFQQVEKNLGVLAANEGFLGHLNSAFQSILEQAAADRAQLLKTQEEVNSQEYGLILELEELGNKYNRELQGFEEKRAGWEESWERCAAPLRKLFPFVPSNGVVHSSDVLKRILLEMEGKGAEWESKTNHRDRYAGIARDWIERIKNRTPKDQKDLFENYIANTNVIGATCSVAGKAWFHKEYGPFDVVVVDEVSKATPPELLLPLLIGKKVVLIGDDRQLPPMIGPESISELAEEAGCQEDELRHLQVPLFRTLWQSAPEAIKTMLRVQYRMHPAIMNVINQFYDFELECGIESPDAERAHGCGGARIPEDLHSVWVDVPPGEAFEETKVGTSYCNDAESRHIQVILQELNRAWEPRVRQGEPPKEVGLITFYAQQARLMEDHLDEEEGVYPNLRLRVGTVDRFQGMERPIVIVSMVRNNRSGDIGFARSPERINVAFSRARELLIIVGCSSLFCSDTKAVSAIPFYRNVERAIKGSGGWKSVSDFPID